MTCVGMDPPDAIGYLKYNCDWPEAIDQKRIHDPANR
jgi:hypothetical protein